MNNEFKTELVGSLQQAETRKQVNADIRRLEKALDMLRLTATLDKGESRKEMNRHIRLLEAQLDRVKLKARLDSCHVPHKT